MFTAALFTIAKTWKQSKCSSTDEWIKQMCYVAYINIYNIYTHTHTNIYVIEYYLAIKKE